MPRDEWAPEDFWMPVKLQLRNVERRHDAHVRIGGQAAREGRNETNGGGKDTQAISTKGDVQTDS